MFRLSVIVPVYKVEEYLPNCIESILQQTYRNFELILVDDGSPDQCGDICEQYATKDYRIKVIHKKNGGQSSARNKGIDIAQGELIAFVDSDDKIAPDMFKDMIDFLDKKNLDIVCCDTYLVRDNKKKVRLLYSEDKIFLGNSGVSENLKGCIDNAVWNKIYKREIFDKLRFTEGIIYEDVRLMYLLFFGARRIGYLSKPYYYYYKRKNSTIANSFNSKGRYDCFVGYKNRLNFAIEKELSCVDECRCQAVSTALSTMTAFYANNENTSSKRFMDVVDFIRYNSLKVQSKLKFKERILLWSFNNCTYLHRIYATLSGLSKKIG